MKAFRSYAREQERIARQIDATRSNQGHDVFLETTPLKPAMEFDARIATEIERSDLMICLISPSYLESGPWARTERKIAKQHWKKAHGRVSPVMVVPTSPNDVDPFLASVNMLHPDGNVAAEVMLAIREFDAKPKPNPETHVSEGLVPHRVTAYKTLWMLTNALPKWPRSDSVTHQRLFELSRELREWYFLDGGGMFLSRRSQTAYAAVQNGLTAIVAEGQEGLIGDAQYDEIRDLCSALRTSLAADIGARGHDNAIESQDHTTTIESLDK